MDEGISRTTGNGIDNWRQFWTAQGMPWRVEPEISTERQAYLASRRVVMPDAARGIFPFAGEALSRADVEWLLATHTSRGTVGPVDWADPTQRDRRGLDLQAANLSRADLVGLPLAGTNLQQASLAETNLSGAHLEAADLSEAQVERSLLRGTFLSLANLGSANLKEVDARQCDLYRASLLATRLEGADLREANMDAALLVEAKIDRARLADARWGEANVAGIDWRNLRMLGDEYVARMPRASDGKRKSREQRLAEYRAAVRAYQGLAPLLQIRSLVETSNRFGYRTRLLQRRVLLRERNWFGWFGSLSLDLLAGYGYRPGRLLVSYLLLIAIYAFVYWLDFANTQTPLSWYEAYIYSLQVVIGRTVPGNPTIADPINAIGDSEIIVSLFYGFILANVVGKRFLGD